MIDRGAQDRKPEGHVDAVAEARVLQHGEPLIVVHRDHAIEFARFSGNEDRIGRKRTGHGYALLTKRYQRRGDDLDFLPPEISVLAGMRIEAAHSDARLGDTELGGELVGDNAHRSCHQCFGDRRRNRGERQVGGRQCYAQRTGRGGPDQHHDHRGAGALGQELGVAAESHAGIVDHTLLYRRSDHGGEFAGEASGQRGVQRREHRFGIARVESSGNGGYRQRKMRDLEGSRRGVAPANIRNDAHPRTQTAGAIAQ